MDVTIEKRFDRVELKLDQLSETVAVLARIDERLVSSHKRLDRHEVRLDLLESDIRVTERAMAKVSGKNMVGERMAWIVFSAAIAAAAKYF